MVDVSRKVDTKRTAHARAIVELPHKAVVALEDVTRHKKGSPLHVAVLGGIMAAKQTSALIPLCHQIPLDGVDVNVERSESNPNQIIIDCHVSCLHKTGVEMEALVGCSIAALTVYDMLKVATHGIEIRSVRLISKTGGKNDYLATKIEE